MEARFRLWWKKIKQHPSTTGIVVLLVLTCIFLAYLLRWDWTGFNSGTSQITITNSSKGNYTATVSQPSKSLWDWLGLLALLAVPVVVGFGAAWFTAQQAQASEANRARQDRESEANREKRHQTDLEIAEKNRELQQQTDLEIAANNQQAAALQTYLDQISELLLNKYLGMLRPEDGNVRKIARTRTLIILRQLDLELKGSILQFLYEAGLINGDKDKVVIQLQGADLNGANLTRIFLNGVNLSRVDLNEAILYRALLTNAILELADLRGANMREADLIRCDLSNADLTEADLSGAILIGANLRGAIGTTPEQLAKAKTLQGATMPDGSIHP